MGKRKRLYKAIKSFYNLQYWCGGNRNIGCRQHCWAARNQINEYYFLRKEEYIQTNFSWALM